MYENLERHDLQQIFNETILLYEKNPVFVRSVGEDGLLNLEVFGTQKRISRPATDVNFDFTPIPLGMCNCDKKAVFLSRAPKRQFKQGLSVQSLIITPLDGYRKGNEAEYIWDRGAHGTIISMVKGVYPTITEAIKAIEENVSETVAFHRYFAINGESEVFFKGKRVGMYDQKKKDFIFNKSKEYLSEVLEYAGAN